MKKSTFREEGTVCVKALTHTVVFPSGSWEGVNKHGRIC